MTACLLTKRFSSLSVHPDPHVNPARDSQPDITIYYSASSDSDTSGAEHPSPKSSSGVGKYKPPHKKNSASAIGEERLRPNHDLPSPPPELLRNDLQPILREAQHSATLPARSDEGSSISTSPGSNPSSPAISASSSSTMKQLSPSCALLSSGSYPSPHDVLPRNLLIPLLHLS